jgi:hypothetical protein
MAVIRHFHPAGAPAVACAFIIDSLQRLNCHSNFLPMIAALGGNSPGDRDDASGREASRSRQWGGRNGYRGCGGNVRH